MSEGSTSAKLLRIALNSVLVGGAPILAIATGFIKHHPLYAIALIAIWELVIIAANFATRVWSKLLDRWVDRLTSITDNTLTRWSSGYTRTYKKHIRAANSHMEQLGLATRSEFALGLHDIYISLSLDPNSVHALSANILDYTTTTMQRTSDSIWHWIAESRQYKNILTIIGPPGSGKTTVLKDVALIVASSRRRMLKKLGIVRGTLPVILTLRDLKSEFQCGTAQPRLPDLIRRGLADLDHKEPPNWVEWHLRRNRLLIMLDGLDEIALPDTRRSISSWVDRQQELYPDTTFIVTSRPFGYQSAPLKAATVVQVRPFSEKEIKEFVARWYKATARRRYGEMNGAAQLYASKSTTSLISRVSWSADMLELAVNPLLLTMICNVHEYRGALPGTRLELHKEICEALLSRRNQDRGIESEVAGSKKQTVLQTLALHMMQEGLRDVASEDFEQILAEVVARVSADYTPLQLIQEIEKSSGLIVEREKDRYGFAHLDFQEYLASVEILEKGLEVILHENLDNPWWRETVLLYAAQSDVTEIVLKCVERSDDLSMLSLAVSCSDVGREISPSARRSLSRLQTGDFRKYEAQRRTAGAVKLFSRLRSFTRVAEDTYASRWPVTWLEYQMFLDETSDSHLIPDQWRENVYPDGRHDEAAVGLRASDAIQFCNWLQTVYRGGWSYRPIDAEIARSLSDGDFLEKGTLDVTYTVEPYVESEVSHNREELNAGNFEVRRFVVGSMPIGLGAAKKCSEAINAEMEVDRQVLKLRVGNSIDRSGLDDSGLLDDELTSYLISHQARDRVLRDALESFCQETMWLDLDRTTYFAESADQSARALLVLPDFEGSHDDVWKLSGLAEICSRGVAIALNRTTAPEARFDGSREERFTARVASIAAFRVGRRLAGDRDVAPISTSVSAWRFDEPVSAARLAFQFLQMYCDLLMLESRLNGRSQAFEGLFLARTRL